MPGTKKEKELKRRFGKLVENMPAYYDHLNLSRLIDLDDDGFAYIISGISAVNMLDLNETKISNESIKLLPGLQSISELRLKECPIDNGCISYLNKLVTLTLLHVKDTGITIEGLLQLSGLVNLKELYFSVRDVEQEKNKIELLREILPGCTFTINGKYYRTEKGQ